MISYFEFLKLRMQYHRHIFPSALAIRGGSIVNYPSVSKNDVTNALGYTPLGTLSKQKVGLTSAFTTNSNTMVDVTGATITMPNRAGGQAIVIFVINFAINTLTGDAQFQILDNGVAQEVIELDDAKASDFQSTTKAVIVPTNGQIVKLQCLSTDGTSVVSIFGTSGSHQTYIRSHETS